MKPMINQVLIKIIQEVKKVTTSNEILEELNELEKFYSTSILDMDEFKFPCWENFRNYIYAELRLGHNLEANIDLLSDYLFNNGRFDFITEEGSTLLNKYEKELFGEVLDFDLLKQRELKK